MIELLVVIAIIGILATIVLINLNTARNKAKDAAIKGALSEARAAAEMWYDDQTPNSYATFCAGATSEWVLRINPSIVTNGGTSIVCNGGAKGYCIQSALNVTGKFCVDSNGLSGTTDVSCAAGTDCKGVAF